MGDNRRIDLNCDVGESFGHYRLGADADIIPLVTSVNIACGFHAGDFRTMRQTVQMALSMGVAIGAHPGYPDLQGFGRREMLMAPDDVRDLVLYQVGALDAFVRSEGGRLHHVKPHGALYNQAARDEQLARAIVSAVHSYNPSLVLYGQCGTCMAEAGEDYGIRVAEEAFADRRYTDEGLLAPRWMAGAIVNQSVEAASHAVRIVCQGQAPTVTGRWVSVEAKTLCLHGDTPHAVDIACDIRAALTREGVEISSQM